MHLLKQLLGIKNGQNIRNGFLLSYLKSVIFLLLLDSIF